MKSNNDLLALSSRRPSLLVKVLRSLNITALVSPLLPPSPFRQN